MLYTVVMLADDIITDKVLAEGNPGFELYQETIKIAQKFSLSRDFAVAADGLTANQKELEKVAPYCRLPYPVCWFEVAQGDRQHWMQASTHFPQDQGPPSRIGFLCVAEVADKEKATPDLSKWKTMLCWSLKEHEIKRIPDGKGGFWIGNQTPNNASPLIACYDMSTPESIEECLSFDWVKYQHVLERQYAHNPKHLRDLLQSDWSGEIHFMLAVLGLLNTRNVTEIERVDYTRLNRRRVLHKKHPLSSHKVLKIRLQHRRSLTGSGIGTSAEIRAHFVIGHFKTRKSGIFWWGPHMRGKLKYGYVAKDYQLEG